MLDLAKFAFCSYVRLCLQISLFMIILIQFFTVIIQK